MTSPEQDRQERLQIARGRYRADLLDFAAAAAEEAGLVHDAQAKREDAEMHRAFADAMEDFRTERDAVDPGSPERTRLNERYRARLAGLRGRRDATGRGLMNQPEVRNNFREPTAEELGV